MLPRIVNMLTVPKRDFKNSNLKTKRIISSRRKAVISFPKTVNNSRGLTTKTMILLFFKAVRKCCYWCFEGHIMAIVSLSFVIPSRKHMVCPTFLDIYMLASQNMIPSRELTYPPDKAYLKMIFLFPRWDMLISWRVYLQSILYAAQGIGLNVGSVPSKVSPFELRWIAGAFRASERWIPFHGRFRGIFRRKSNVFKQVESPRTT